MSAHETSRPQPARCHAGNRSTVVRAAALCVPLALAAGPALAHGATPVHAPDIVAGFLHPLSGLDHILAALLAGVLAARLGGQARRVLPAVFLGVLVLAAGAGTALAMPFSAEIGIQLSLAALVAAAAFARPRPLLAATAVVGAGAAFHGFAHAAEMPQGVAALGYFTGFTLATGLVLAAGLGAASLLGRGAAARAAA